MEIDQRGLRILERHSVGVGLLEPQELGCELGLPWTAHHHKPVCPEGAKRILFPSVLRVGLWGIGPRRFLFSKLSAKEKASLPTV